MGVKETKNGNKILKTHAPSSFKILEYIRGNIVTLIIALVLNIAVPTDGSVLWFQYELILTIE